MPAARRALLLVTALATTALLLAACGSSSGSDGTATTTTAASSGSGTPKIPVTPAGAKGCRTAADAAKQAKPPAVTVPAKAETSIAVTDDIPGCGDLVTKSSTVSVQYILKSRASGQVVDSSWSRNEPFSVTLGQGQVISGWDLGIPGMRAGGERTLTLGPDYGYGAAGQPPTIAANDTLVFVIDVLSVS